MTGPEVLFVGHGAERTGPPVFLANLQRWLAAHDDLSFATVLTRGGALLPDYERCGPVRVLDPRWTLPRVAQQGLARTARGERAAGALRSLRDRAHLRGWDDAPLVYVNTASPATARTLAGIPDGPTVVVHVHELEVALRYQLAPEERTLLLGRADQFIAASRAVADNLATIHGVDPARIEVHHEFVEPVDPLDADQRAAARRTRGIDPDTFVIVGSGMTEWRKGPDLFVALAAELRCRVDRPMVLVWVGGATSGPTWWPLDHEARHRGVEDAVRFVGQQDDPGSWFRLADAFALTSREDAFPLAAVEAATAGVPLVSFDSGGISELIRPGGAGEVVAYPDIGAMAEVLARWAADEPTRRRIGTGAGDHSRAHHLTAVAAPALAARLHELLP